jgi:DNA-binding transcriptional MerR regulator
MDRDLVTPRELAGILGISLSSVNYYTNLGLFDVKEQKRNSRLYDLKEIKARFLKIKQMRKEGYSLRVIRKELNR